MENNLHIIREHTLTLEEARKITQDWIISAENDYRMKCEYQQDAKEDKVTFTRSGVSGVLIVTADSFEMTAKLGFLFKSFLPKINEQINKNLDELLQGYP